MNGAADVSKSPLRRSSKPQKTRTVAKNPVAPSSSKLRFGVVEKGSRSRDLPGEIGKDLESNHRNRAERCLHEKEDRSILKSRVCTQEELSLSLSRIRVFVIPRENFR